MLSPLARLKEFSKHVADGDFSKDSPEYRIEEAAALSEGFNAITKNISALFLGIVKSFNRLKSDTSHLCKVIDTSAAAAGKISGGVAGLDAAEKNVREKTDSVKSQTTVIDGEVRRLN